MGFIGLSRIFWYFSGLKAYNGQFKFYNVDDLETMATAEHFMATDVDWDPTGRQVSVLIIVKGQSLIFGFFG